MSLFEQTELFQRLSVFPALTLMVFTRTHIGFRLLHPLVIGLFAFAMVFLSALVSPSILPKFLFWHGCAFAVLSVIHRLRRWWDFRKGVKQHSYYLGTSIFDVSWPRFVRRHRLIARWVEPLLWFALAYWLAQRGAVAEALWIGFCAMFLRAAEEYTHRRERNRDMDMVDGLVASEVQSDTVEQFSQSGTSAASAAVASGGAIATGLSPELKALMARRSQSEAPLETTPAPLPPAAKLTNGRACLAIALALLIDLGQLSLTFYQYDHPSFIWLAVCPALAAAILALFVKSLRFHWLMVPAFLLESVPLYLMLPGWTVCTGLVIWRRKRKPKPSALPAPPKALRIKEALAGCVLIVAPLLCAGWLVLGIAFPPANHEVATANQRPSPMLEAAKKRADEARANGAALVLAAKAAVEPGPEPNIFFKPMERAKWMAQKRAWDDINTEVAQAQRAQAEAEDELLRLNPHLAALTHPSEWGKESKRLWGRYVAPVLHGLLAFSLIRFSVRCGFRLLLLKDRIGAIQL